MSLCCAHQYLVTCDLLSNFFRQGVFFGIHSVMHESCSPPQLERCLSVWDALGGQTFEPGGQAPLDPPKEVTTLRFTT